MQNDSIDTLMLRHYGSAAPAPVDLEQRLCALVHQESAAMQVKDGWNQRRVSRRRILQLVTLSGAGLGVLAVGINVLQSNPRKSAYAV